MRITTNYIFCISGQCTIYKLIVIRINGKFEMFFDFNEMSIFCNQEQPTVHQIISLAF